MAARLGNAVYWLLTATAMILVAGSIALATYPDIFEILLFALRPEEAREKYLERGEILYLVELPGGTTVYASSIQDSKAYVNYAALAGTAALGLVLHGLGRVLRNALTKR